MIRGELDKSLGLCPAKTPFRARSEVPILVTWEEEFLCSIQILLRSYGGRERGYPTTSHRLSEVMLQLLLLRISLRVPEGSPLRGQCGGEDNSSGGLAPTWTSGLG